jgi:hypothetical protein
MPGLSRRSALHRLIRTLALLALGFIAFPYSADAQYEQGKGSLGGSVGAIFTAADKDIKHGQKLRPIFKLHFGYVMTERWRLSLRAGFGWKAYQDDALAPYPLQQCCGQPDDVTKIDMKTLIYPFTGVVQYTKTLNDTWMLFGGLGPGIYNIQVTNDSKVVYDPVTFVRVNQTRPGLATELGAEMFLSANQNVSFEYMGTIHWIFSHNVTDYPSGFGGNDAFWDLNFGVNVYFGLGDGGGGSSESDITPVFTDEDNVTPGDGSDDGSVPAGGDGSTEPEGDSDTP